MLDWPVKCNERNVCGSNRHKEAGSARGESPKSLLAREMRMAAAQDAGSTRPQRSRTSPARLFSSRNWVAPRPLTPMRVPCKVCRMRCGLGKTKGIAIGQTPNILHCCRNCALGSTANCMAYRLVDVGATGQKLVVTQCAMSCRLSLALALEKPRFLVVPGTVVSVTGTSTLPSSAFSSHISGYTPYPPKSTQFHS